MAKPGTPSSLLATYARAKADLQDEEFRPRRGYEPGIPLAKARLKVLELETLINEGVNEWLRTSAEIEAMRADLEQVTATARDDYAAIEAVTVPTAPASLPLSEAHSFELDRQAKLRDLQAQRRTISERLLAQYAVIGKRVSALREREIAAGGLLHDPSSGHGISAPIDIAIGLQRIGAAAECMGGRKYDLPRNARECRDRLELISATRTAPPSQQDKLRADRLKQAQADLDKAQADWDAALAEMREKSVKR